ncbi:MAG: Subtilisin [Candidatus Heimdallarchaeota archaeon LC_2]|nr:MAG: Subtilisin [Candidatus Heimdallarchaeota archaeon LC_2]
MISGINPVLSDFNLHVDEPYQQIQTIPELNYDLLEKNNNKIQIIDAEISRILFYESFDYMEKAAKQLTDLRIKHKYHIMPALTTTGIRGYEIPLEGLKSITENTKSVTMAVDQQKSISDVLTTGFDLDFTADKIGVSFLHELGFLGDGIEVAVIDSGIKGDLPSFINGGVKRVTEWTVPDISEDMEISNHATHVTGILAGNGIYTINGKTEQYDSTGMAPNSIIHSLRVLDSSGFGEIDWVVQGMEKAIDLGVDIMSLSLSSELYNGSSDIHEEAVRVATEAGIIIVSAAGNLGPIGSGIGVPGALEQVITVGASNFIKTDTGYNIGTYQFSAVGPRVNDYPSPDLVAPGVNILSVDKDSGGARSDTGTSMATPHISGGIALLRQAFPNATVFQIREALLASASEMSFSEPVEKVGRGFVNFEAAYGILNNTTTTVLGSTTFAMASSPRVIKDENLYFRHQISGKTKTLPFFVHSSREVTLKPLIDNEKTYGVNFQFPSTIAVKEGLNKFLMNITITSKNIEFVNGRIYFEDDLTDIILPYANISFFAFVRYGQADILFDSSKDFDTKSKTYFGGHSPRGQFSHFASILENEGHSVDENRFNNITSDLLNNYDVLIIANPDLNYNSEEISAIRNFIYNQGKSLLIIAGGGLLSAETNNYASFNSASLGQILDGSGMDFNRNDQGQAFTSINACDELGINDRLALCYEDAETSNSQNVLSTLVQFPHFGPQLEIEEVAGASVQVVALLNSKPVILASELQNNQGRILLFSSPLVFDNKAQLIGYGSLNNDKQISDNNKLSTEAINWLIEPNSVNVQYSINGKNVGEEANINLHQTITVRLTVNNINVVANTLNVSLVRRHPDIRGLIFENIQFNKLSENVYETIIQFPTFGSYEFFVHLQDPTGDLIATDAHIRIFAALENFYDQEKIHSIAIYLFIALMASWGIFIYNEGGRKLYIKKKRKAEELK